MAALRTDHGRLKMADTGLFYGWNELTKLLRPVALRFLRTIEAHPHVDIDDLINYALMELYREYADGEGQGVIMPEGKTAKGFVCSVAFKHMYRCLQVNHVLPYDKTNKQREKIPSVIPRFLSQPLSSGVETTLGDVLVDTGIPFEEVVEMADMWQRKLAKLTERQQSVLRAVLEGRSKADGDVKLGQRNARRVYANALRAMREDTECDLCGEEMEKEHCKLMCSKCGYIRDCTDY